MSEPGPPNVVVIGEALVDVVRTRTGAVVETPGGSPLNVGITLGRLGVPTALITALGTDDRGVVIEKHLADSGVRLAPEARCLPRTSTATADMQADGSARYDFDVTWAPVPTVELPPATAVHAGSIALFLEPGAATVRRLLGRAAGSSLVSLDPNIRPSLLPDRAVVLAEFERLLPLADVVKLSDEDAQWLLPGVSESDVLRHLLDRGPALVALTRGGHGALIASSACTVEAAAAPTTLVDTIGAGDSYMGALVEQIISRGLDGDLRSRHALWPEEIEPIARAAAAVAAVTVGRRGANPPWRSELPTTSLDGGLPLTPSVPTRG